MELDTSASFRLKVCQTCTKPNAFALKYCSTCATSLESAPVKIVDKCIFCDIISHKKQDEVILYRDDLICIFIAEFAISPHQVLVCSLEHITDISSADTSQKWTSLLSHMYTIGTEILRKLLRQRSTYSLKFFEIPPESTHNHCSAEPSSADILPDVPQNQFSNLSLSVFQEDINNSFENFHYGFNVPPQIPHLHLVIFTLPLLRDEFSPATISYPRWLPYWSVEESLRECGHVKTGQTRTDEEKYSIYRNKLVTEHYRRKEIVKMHVSVL